MASFLLGVVLLAAFQMVKSRRKAQAEAAFDAALQDSGLGLDDAFEQVSQSRARSPLLHLAGFHIWCCDLQGVLKARHKAQA